MSDTHCEYKAEYHKLYARVKRLEEEFIPVEPPSEAAGCVPCFTCGGFKLPGRPCAFCKGRLEGKTRKLRILLDALEHTDHGTSWCKGGSMCHVCKALREIKDG